MSTELAVANDSITALPLLVDRAAKVLASARNSAEVLEAMRLASDAYDAAKKAGRFARAKGAHDDLLHKVYRSQADGLELEAGAKRLLADEYDAAQERGEVRGQGGDHSKLSDEKFGPADLGLSHGQIHEARTLRDAEVVDPGIIRRTLDERIEQGEEPTKAALREAVLEAAKQGLRGSSGAMRRKVPSGSEGDPQFAVMLIVAGGCRDMLARASGYAPEYIVGGFVDAAMRERNLTTIRQCRDFLNQILETAHVEHEACTLS